MIKAASFPLCRWAKDRASFTLIELLTVMAIIAILAALVLGAASGVMKQALRKRASTEIQAMCTALESYKTDNATYPQSDGALVSSSYVTYDGTTVNYQTNSTLLFVALWGTNYYSATPAKGMTVYLPSVKVTQVGNPAGPYSYFQDPWGYSYGYSTATNSTADSFQWCGILRSLVHRRDFVDAAATTPSPTPGFQTGSSLLQ